MNIYTVLSDCTGELPPTCITIIVVYLLVSVFVSVHTGN